MIEINQEVFLNIDKNTLLQKSRQELIEINLALANHCKYINYILNKKREHQTLPLSLSSFIHWHDEKCEENF